ncbi:MAG: spermine synthase, partial [Chloroflexi bacterium]|nr:spermine synthase [Chloroflexota bacterium]
MLSLSLAVTAWLGGLTTLMLELAAGRLLRIFLGASNLVWAAIIGLILLYLTLGAWLGGRLADRWPSRQSLAWVFMAAAVGVVVAAVAARPFLLRASTALGQGRFSVLLLAFVTVLLFFAWPVTLLGMVSPMVLRLAQPRPDQVGRVSGWVSAIGTLGAFLGTFLPDLVLVPWLGIRRTFLLIALLLATWGLYLWPRSRTRVVLALGWMALGAWLWFVWSAGPLRPAPGLIYEKESAYNLIQVWEREGWRLLILNEGQGVHSIYHPEHLTAKGSWMHFHAAPFLQGPPFEPGQVRSVAIVGLAGGTAARQAAAFYPHLQHITGWEIDPEVLAVGYQFFGLGEVTLLEARVQDGRLGLRQDPRRYDLIILDAYRPPYIPAHLATREFFQLVRAHLTEHGAVALNVGRTEHDRRLVDAFYATLSTVFPTVYGMDVPGTYNTVLYASPRAIANPRENLFQQAQRLAR